VRIYNAVLDTASVHQLFENGADGRLVSGIAKLYAPALRFNWGSGDNACSTHPTRKSPSCSTAACASTGCYFGYTQCKAGDASDGTRCWVPCRSGYTDMGVTCTNWNTLDTYNQHGYDFDYTLPTTDDGIVD
jgi:hypothetical protein